MDQEKRLESWKEIEAYLNRDVRTLRRWEKEEGLPVHRHSHKARASVYAFSSEIDAWRQSRKQLPQPVPPRPLWKMPAFAVTLALCLVMVGNGARSASASQPIAAKRVQAAKGRIMYSTLSSDGQWIGGTDWNNGDVVLTNVRSGKMTRLVTGTFDQDPDTWGEYPLLSPDRKQVAYWWYDSSDAKVQGQIRVVANRLRATPRVLVESTGGTEGAWPLAWSPDGKRILASLQKRDDANRLKRDIGWVSVENGSIQVIQTLDPWNGGGSVRPRLSPDGRYVVYSGRMRADAPDTAIFLFSASGGASIQIAGGGSNSNPVWTPDSSHILFISNRSGSSGLWTSEVRSGPKAAVPSLVRPDTTVVRTLGITPDGHYIYDYDAGLQQIVIREFDPAAARARDTELSTGFVGIAPSFSQDGKWLAYKRSRGNFEAGYGLVLHSLEKGTEWAIPSGPLGDMTPVWYTDGSVQAVGGRVRVSVGSSAPETLQASVGLPLGTLTRDAKTIFATQAGDIVEVDSTSGSQRRSVKIPGFAVFPAVSPDAKTLAVLNVHGGIKLSRVSVDGSDYRELVSPVAETQPVWTPDGRWIVFVQPENGSLVKRVMRIPASGGTPEFTGIRAEGLHHIALSPDGSRIAYSFGTSVEEVWSLENVLAALK